VRRKQSVVLYCFHFYQVLRDTVNVKLYILYHISAVFIPVSRYKNYEKRPSDIKVTVEHELARFKVQCVNRFLWQMANVILKNLHYCLKVEFTRDSHCLHDVGSAACDNNSSSDVRHVA